MADTTTTTEQPDAKAPDATTEGQEPQGTDWKEMARKWERRAKENKGLADELQKQIDAADAKGKEADAKEQKASEALEQLRQENKRLQASIEREHKVREIAASKGVDPDVLLRMRCDTDQEITECADMLAKAYAKPKTGWPEAKDNGGSGQKAPGMTREEILAIKNPKEQLRAIAENKSLFK